jgi:hypothetical protein
MATMQLHERALADLDHPAAVDAVAASCATRGGRVALRRILSSPLTDASLLRARARDVAAVAKAAAASGGGSGGLREALAAAGADEEAAAWCLADPESREDDEREALDQPFFASAPVRPLNRARPALWLGNAYTVYGAPALALLAPLSYLLTPYLLIRYRMKIAIDFRTFVSLMYHSMKGTGAALRAVFGDAPSFAMQAVSLISTCALYLHAIVCTVRRAIAVRGVCLRVVTRVNALARALRACDAAVDALPEALFGRWERPRGARGLTRTGDSGNYPVVAEHPAGTPAAAPPRPSSCGTCCAARRPRSPPAACPAAGARAPRARTPAARTCTPAAAPRPCSRAGPRRAGRASPRRATR